MSEQQDHSVRTILANALENTDPDGRYFCTDVVQIVGDYLEINRFDGLYLDGECACEIDDLSPGECLGPKCQAGYRRPSPEYGFVIEQRRQAR